MKQRTSIGGLLLESGDEWTFSNQHGVIVGQRTNDAGMLRLTAVGADMLTQPASNEQCYEIAQHAANADGLQPIAVSAMVSVTGPFGAASFARERDFVRVWYCCRPAGLIVGMYACPAAIAGTQNWKFVTGQCAKMVYSALFDRPSWGATDTLTQALIPRPAPEIPPAVKGNETGL